MEKEILTWQAYLRSHGDVTEDQLEELVSHLRDEIDQLRASGLSEDEAFIVAVRRFGRTSEVAREFSKTQKRQLWKHLLIDPVDGVDRKSNQSEVFVVVVLALLAGLLSRIPELFGISLVDNGTFFYVRNITFLVIPAMVGLFLWRFRHRRVQGGVFYFILFVSVVAVNSYPLFTTGSFDLLIGIHVPIVVWLAAGLVYTGKDWRNPEREMDFVRFTGEGLVYLVLIYCGGGVLILTAMLLFSSIGIDAERVLIEYVAVAGACAAPVVAAYLALAKRNIIENMAPVLAKIFMPLFLLLMATFLAVVAVTGNLLDLGREVLIGFDLLLAVVWGIVFYVISARDENRDPGPMDMVCVALIIAALLVDLVVLVAVGTRISAFGFSPNKMAALGENVVLFASLLGSAFFYIRFLAKKQRFRSLLSWQIGYLPVVGIWAAVVAFLFPLIFRLGY